jgi:hypothetical protein
MLKMNLRIFYVSCLVVTAGSLAEKVGLRAGIWLPLHIACSDGPLDLVIPFSPRP